MTTVRPRTSEVLKSDDPSVDKFGGGASNQANYHKIIMRI